jgi:hypothetical protein
MTAPVKAILIVFGVLFVIVCGGIGGLIYLGHSALDGANDPAARRRIAAKLATFSLPPGYRIASALDFASRLQVDIAPDDVRSSFRIKLTGGPLEGDAASQAQGVDLGLRLVGGFAKCTFRPEPDDTVVVAGRPTTLQVRACPTSSLPMRVETGTLPNGVTLVAMGARGDFDTAALHALLRSFK